MPSITIAFSNPLNTSCQVGDIAHAVATTSVGGFSANILNNIITIGQIREIVNGTSDSPQIICDTILSDASNVSGRFILFTKDESVNASSLTGYYASMKFVCDDTEKAELFSVATQCFESSK